MSAGDLDRFVDAQDGVMPRVEAELAAGRKQSHWMWFVFPQIAGLGSSATAQYYAIADLDHARRYLAHPSLGRRLRESVGLALRHRGVSARDMFGSPDDLKFRSCLTLFAAASSTEDDDRLFGEALRVFYEGRPDERTLELLRRPGSHR